MQVRWAWATLTGLQTCASLKQLPACSRYLLLDDLGWPNWWHSVVAQAVSMYQKMQLDDDSFDHSVASRRTMPSQDAWVAAVRNLMSVHSLPPWDPAPDDLLSLEAKQRSLVSYRRNVILPQLLTRERSSPLPWIWLASTAGRLFSKSAFTTWFLLRITGRSTPLASSPCQLCGLMHKESKCLAFLSALADHSLQCSKVLDYPVDAVSFIVILRVIDGIFPMSSLFRRLS